MSVKNINGQNFKDTLSGLADTVTAEDIEAATTHRNNLQNPHAVTKAQVGLGNADNTADADKPVSTATQTALDDKIDKDGTKVLSDNNFTNDFRDKLVSYSENMDKDASQVKLVGYTEPVNTGQVNSGDSVTIAIGKLERRIDNVNANSGDSNVQSNWNEVDVNSDAYILNKPTTITPQQSQSIIDLSNDSHTHANSAVVSNLTESNGKLFYDGSPVNDTVVTEVIDGFGSSSTTKASSANNARLLKIDINNISTNITTLMSHKDSTSNPHAVTKVQVGLGNVDNTSDINKPISTATQTSLNAKVDKDGSKVLSDNNFTDALLTKVNALSDGTGESIVLTGYAIGANSDALVEADTVNSAFGKLENRIGELETDSNHPNETNNPHNVTKAQVGLSNVDNTSDADKPVSSAVTTALDNKIDKDGSKVLSDNNFSDMYQNRLNSVENGATANSSDAILKDRANHTGSQNISTVTNLQTELDWKEPVLGNPSSNNMILSSNVNGDRTWVAKDEGGTDLSVTRTGADATIESSTGDDIVLLEASITKAGLMTKDDKIKLNSISADATENQSDGYLLNRTNHTGTQQISTISGLQNELDSFESDLGNPALNNMVLISQTDGTRAWVNQTSGVTNLSKTLNASTVTVESSSGDNVILAGATTTTAGIMTSTDKTKLDSLNENATVNDTDANLKNRANHTGTQDISTINNLQQSLNNKEDNLGTPTVNGMVLVSQTDGTRTWETQGDGSTDLSNSVTISTVTVESSTGDNTVLQSATPTGAGVMSRDDKVKLNAVEEGATANQSDLYLLNRTHHDGVQSISTIDGLQTALNSKEDGLGNPDTNGKILSSTSDGTRSWIDAPATVPPNMMSSNDYDTTGTGNKVDTALNAEKINNLTVQTAVPVNAVFTDTVYTHPTVSGSKHIPMGGTTGNVLVWSDTGTATWGNVSSSGAGDMLKSTYDTNDSGVVDNAETVNGHTVQTPVPLNAIFTDTVYTHPVTTGNKHIPSGGSNGDILSWSGDGTAVWSASGSGDMNKAVYDTNDNGRVDDSDKVNNLTVETAVPLNAVFTDTLYAHPTTSGDKHIPSGGSANKVLVWDSDGTAIWGDVAGSGDMVKATYDTNDSGVIDNSEKVNNLTVETAVPAGAIFTDTVYTHPIGGGNNHIPDGGQSGNILTWDSAGTAVWANITGTGDMNKATYDTNDNGIVDNAEKVNNFTVEAAVPVGAVFTDTTYSVGNSGLTEINFTNVLKSTYDGKENGLGDPDANGKILSSQTDGTRSWINAPSGSTNISSAITGVDVIINSSTGTGATIPSATATDAGVMSKDDKIKLDAIASGATANDTDANLLNRANHTGTQAVSTIVGLSNELSSKENSLGDPDVDGKVLSSLSDGTRSWVTVNTTGATNLSTVKTGALVTIESSTGTNTDISSVTITEAGVMSKDDKIKLDGISALATANDTDANLLDRTNHTGSQPTSTITGLDATLNGKESSLGNPDVDGKILSSLADGTRSWVEASSGVSNGSDVTLDTTNFDKGLSTTDTNVQIAFETVDEQIGDIDTALASILGREI